ncbi:MAG: hypothetical protein Q8N14_06725 [Candidatus Omnitrophota bacterium]|nr:hypothetical protein [Candidatus Omnitrophota bacterium]
MLSDNSFRLSIGFSLLVHSVILLFLPKLTTSQMNRTLEKIEVTYYKLQALSEALQPKSGETKPPEMKKNFKDNISLLSKDRLPAIPLAKDASHFFKKIDAQERKPLTIKQFMAQKKISLPPIKSEKMKNPVYNNYYQIIREKIRHRAYTNYSRYETGEVYLTFVVTSDGNLKAVKLMEEKTRAAGYLQEVALKSINDAAPFPSFPANLQFPELSFNVVISFEVNN